MNNNPKYLDSCRIIDFPKVNDTRGNLSFIEEMTHVPFDIKRVYYLYDLPSGANRGGHAHRVLESVIIALSGSFDVIVDDGFHKKSFFLNRPHYGVYIPCGIWRVIENFSSNSVALVIVSLPYSESDYIRNYRVFKKMVRNNDFVSATNKNKKLTFNELTI
jgi:oxalate decarboxylase/phosphoglucose isomerase-like protein (cupin superfamily)